MRDACAGRTYLNYTLQVREWNVFIDGSYSRGDGQTQKKLASIQHSNANANQYADDARSNSSVYIMVRATPFNSIFYQTVSCQCSRWFQVSC